MSKFDAFTDDELTILWDALWMFNDISADVVELTKEVEEEIEQRERATESKDRRSLLLAAIQNQLGSNDEHRNPARDTATAKA